MNNNSADNKIAVVPEEDDSIKDIAGASNVDKVEYSPIQLQEVRRELHKLQLSTMKASQKTDELSEKEREKLEGENIKLMQGENIKQWQNEIVKPMQGENIKVMQGENIIPMQDDNLKLMQEKNAKLLQLAQKLTQNDWLIECHDEAVKYRRSQFVSKIPKPKSSSTVRPMSRWENGKSNIPIKIDAIDKANCNKKLAIKPKE